MARSNGGIIGKRNATSHGKSKQTVKTSSGTVTLQSETNKISDDSKHRWNADTKAWVAL